jgi:hypothetical protein
MWWGVVGYVGLLTSHNPASFVINFASVTFLPETHAGRRGTHEGEALLPQGLGSMDILFIAIGMKDNMCMCMRGISTT